MVRVWERVEKRGEESKGDVHGWCGSEMWMWKWKWKKHGRRRMV